MDVDAEIAEAISSEQSSLALKKLAVSKGMKTLREDGLSKVARGITSLEEINRVTGLS